MGDRLATIDTGQKLGAVPLMGKLDPKVTQSGLCRGPCPLWGSWIPRKHNLACAEARALYGEAGSQGNTIWPGPRPYVTFVPSDILIHPAVWTTDMGRKLNKWPHTYTARFTLGCCCAYRFCSLKFFVSHL